MSTAATGQDRPAEPAKALRPVLLFGTSTARITDAIELLLLAVGFRAQFGKLVENPVSTLQTGLLAFGALQTVWALLCCPPAGSQAKKRGANPVQSVILSITLTALVVPLLHIIFVLFGAPFLTHQLETLLCSSILAVLSVFPVFYAHGVNSTAWRAICGFTAPLDETVGGFWGGIIGAWLGAVPIPLDWDREWQKWPITIVCGLVGGISLAASPAGSRL
ncbi:unnamed protein product [Parascedosporium putredinis]|uniref:Glycosylphosphatidylinositol anchor biosynthesis protein 11 n=1 Tax=Parascedosporium putredinis TaxID=1442378 RepID=A0A9P1MC55_9PEZI|nr:unnamed protein product [Parascedosporium putredinis]CAI7995971.1 unnamed protein product [Parascedosporium putredinis]